MEKINFTEPKINGKDPVDYFANFTETKINSMGIRVEYITPDKAKRYLSGNQNNRKLSTSIVNQYSESIKRGEWKLNGESIKFDNDGKLIDGQHRLHAIIKANTGIQMLVISGLNKEVFSTIDAGKKRTAGDCLSIQGVPNYNGIASIIRIYLKMKTSDVNSFLVINRGGSNAINNAIKNITNTQVLDEYSHHAKEYDEITKIARKLYGEMRLLPISLLGAYMSFLIINLGKDKDKVFDFFTQMALGENIKSNAMAYLHKLLIKRINKVLIVTPAELDRYIKKVWNLHQTGDDVSKVIIKMNKKYSFM